MTNIKKLLEERNKDFDEEFCDNTMTVKDGITQIKYKPTAEAIKSHISETNRLLIEKVVEIIRSIEFETAHTYSSENADIYTAYDGGQEIMKEIIIKALTKNNETI